MSEEETVAVLHFIPDEGEREHDVTSMFCWCNPKILRDVTGAYLVHHQEPPARKGCK